MVDGVGVVGAWALHELIEVVQKTLLGLLAREISRGYQRGVGWLAMIFSILFSPLCGGALILILALGLTFASASVEVLWERRSLDASDKGPWSQAIQAGTPIVRSATAPRVRFTTPCDGLAGVYVAYHYCRLMDAIIILGSMSVADDAVSVLVRPTARV